jgi:hypothetical protein
MWSRRRAGRLEVCGPRLVCGFRLAFQDRSPKVVAPKVVAPRPQAGQKMMHMSADRNGTARPASADPFLAPTPVPMQAADSDASVRFSPEAQAPSRPVKTSEPAKQVPAEDPARLLREGLLLKKDADYFIASDPAKAMLGFLNTINETSARGFDPNTSRDIQSGWKKIRRMAADALVRVASLAIASAIDRFDKSTGRGTQANQAKKELNADMNDLLNKFDENQVALLVKLMNRYYADAEKRNPPHWGIFPPEHAYWKRRGSTRPISGRGRRHDRSRFAHAEDNDDAGRSKAHARPLGCRPSHRSRVEPRDGLRTGRRATHRKLWPASL